MVNIVPPAAMYHISGSAAGWVAMWRPLEVFLYQWWPIRADIRLFERLGRMPVRIEYRPGI